MTNNKTEIVRRHVAAVSAMLLGSRRMKPGAAIIAGEPIEAEGRRTLSQLATASQTDIVQLEFEDTADGCRLVGIATVMPRGGLCYTVTDCRLYLSKSGTRAVIVATPNIRGSFRLAPGELIHVDRKPDDLEAGIARAEARMRKLVARGVSVDGQVDLDTFALAA